MRKSIASLKRWCDFLIDCQKTLILVDKSGSMSSPATGFRKGSTSKVRCVDVAGLLASTILRKNPSSCIIPFDTEVRQHNINPRDTVITNAEKLAKMVNGGTNCSAPLEMLNNKNASGDWVILVSDNQSWADTIGYSTGGLGYRPTSYYNAGGHTKFMQQWNKFKERNPQARLVALDLQPYGTTQAQEREDILNVGGFTDSVFNIINLFARGELGADHWLEVIEGIEL
jgi:60 kDa SS-A/Ro ribonucleoprotein